MTVEIVFETHSISEDNEAGRASGWHHSCLSVEGRSLAAALGERRRDDGIAAVFTSDLLRARETADIAFGATGIPTFLDWRLRECDYGDGNGMPAAELHADRSAFVDTPYPTGESWTTAVTRVRGALDDIASRYADRRVLDHRPRGHALGARSLCERPHAARPGHGRLRVAGRLGVQLPRSTVTTWDGDEYQKRFDDLAASGADVHGEVAFVLRYAPASVLDAGCGTGRVAIELARRGVDVMGVDVDASMIATARDRAPGLAWVESDLAALDLARTFDVVVMAGNVPLFTPAGTHAAVVAGCARHVTPDGVLVAGFQLGRGYELDAYDAHAESAGLVLAERFATWDGDPFPGDATYAVSVHRRGR